MICVKCGNKNEPGLENCSQCGAYLVTVIDDSEESIIDVESGFSYLYPEQTYVNQVTFDLVKASYDFCTQGGSKEAVVKAFEAIKKRTLDFENGLLPQMLDSLETYKTEDVGREYARQMVYLLNKGQQLSREGIALLEKFLATDLTDSLVQGVFKFQEGNDYLNVAGLVMKGNLQILEEELNRRLMASRAAEFKPKVEEARAARRQNADEDGEEPAAPPPPPQAESVSFSDEI